MGLTTDEAGRRPVHIVRPGADVRADWLDHRYVIVIRGELDQANVEALEPALDQVDGAGEVRFELEEVSFVDSAGLRVFIQALQAVAPQGGRVVLAKPSATLLRLLELTCLDTHFVIER